MNVEPSFLVGSERSGSTLLRLLLDHHPEVAFNLESEFLVDHVGDDGTYPEVVEYCDQLSRDRVFSHSKFTLDSTLSYAELVNDFLEQKKRRDSKKIVGATVHRHYSRLPGIWPSARYIHLIRDGRDVARSCIEMGWAGNMWTAADIWLRAEDEWDKLRAKLDADQHIEVSFEDLVTSPSQTLDRICRFMQVSFDEAMFDYAKTSSYSMPEPDKIGQWSRKLDDYAIRLAEAKLAPMLDARGYELSGLEPVRVSASRRVCLEVHDRLARSAFRRRRLGTALYVASALARRFHANALQRRLQRRINEIEDSYLK
jgi:hypothetical protein